MPEMKNDVKGMTPQQVMGLLGLAVNGYCAALWPFLHYNIGASAFGFGGLAAMGVMTLFMVYWQVPQMIVYSQIWMALMIVHRVGSLALWARGRREHSHYDGDTLLGLVVPCGEPFIKLVVEPLAVLGLGYYLSSGIGLFLMGGGGALALRRLVGIVIRINEDRSFGDDRIVQVQRMARQKEKGIW